MKQTKIHAGQIEADVTSEGEFGWCGLSQFSHKESEREWLLSPAFTLEHYIGIPMNSDDYIEYEPCYSPKHLECISTDSCTLRYEPASCSQIDCAITYRAAAPHYVDIDVCMKTHRPEWPLNHVALFFATIVKAPIYAGITLLGTGMDVEVKGGNPWIHFNGLATQGGRTVHPIGLEHPELPRPTSPPEAYYYDDSSVRFTEPFFYATVDQMVLAVMFRPENKNDVRFVVNPLAPAFGGPAWDFFWSIQAPQAGKEYRLSARSLFKPFVGADDILSEYEQFVQGQKESSESKLH
ncbi:hypothetical protein KFU94_35125 [Chloroflexi bacterium TSY]|nr:hypothetical protein [Chloroflexi bacterium TSY]